MKIVIINGVAQSGKDTLVEMVKRHALTGVANISSIDPVKDLMKKCGWSPDDKSDIARATMAQIKQALIDLNDGPCWYIQSVIQSLEWNQPDVGIVFVHVREPEEIEKLKWAYPDCLTLLVKRSVHVPDNPADRGVDGYDYDLVIKNDGVERDLELEAVNLVFHLEGDVFDKAA